jgi:pimeloyl-ACP methyl ester carboxylesterase
MGGVVTKLAFPGVPHHTPVPEESKTFFRIETAHFSVPCLRFEHPKARCTIVYCHGNAMAISEMAQHIELIGKQFKANVLLPEIPGVQYDWGRTAFLDGVPRAACEEGYVEAVVGAFDAAKEMGLGVVIWGQSLGSGAACELAVRRPECLAVVLQSPLLSCMKVASMSFPSVCGVDVFVNWRKAPEMKMHVLILHGDADRVIQVEHGVKLAELLPNLFDVVVFPDVGEMKRERI